MFVDLLKRMLKLPRIDAICERATAAATDRTMFETLAEVLDLRMDVSREDRDRIPSDGPVIVVANHPMGGIDGILLGSLMQSIRPDWKFLCHTWFDGRPKLTKHMILVDPRDKSGKRGGNGRAMKECVRWVKRGGMLLVCPAGSVSRFSWRKLAVTDPPWKSGVARLVRLTRATVLPVHIGGRNSWLFQIVSMIHPGLGVALLARELLNKRGTTVQLTVGKPIPYKDLPASGDVNDLTTHLRSATYRWAV